jgi:aspartate aminotransferase
MVLAENKNREAQGRKPLYILYDQIYWTLTFGQTQHFDPVSLFPELRPYTIFIDGLSKAFAATGVRIGWAFGPGEVIAKMKSILGHVGAWAPKAEQVATAQYLQQEQAVSAFLSEFKTALHNRLQGIYEGIEALRAEGFPVQAIAPQAAIYLTAQFNLLGRRTPQGKVLSSTPEITAYLLHEAKLAIVPFSAFGASADSTWYRISVGTCRMEDIPALLAALRTALAALS